MVEYLTEEDTPMNDFRPTFLHPKITKEDAARVMRAFTAAMSSPEASEADTRQDFAKMAEELARDVNVIFGAEGAIDVVEMAYGFRPMSREDVMNAARVPGTNRHV